MKNLSAGTMLGVSDFSQCVFMQATDWQIPTRQRSEHFEAAGLSVKLCAYAIHRREKEQSKYRASPRYRHDWTLRISVEVRARAFTREEADTQVVSPS